MDFDSYTTPESEELLHSAQTRYDEHRNESRILITEAASAGLFLACAIACALLLHSSRHLSLIAVGATLAGYLVAYRIVFPVAAGWTRPTQVVFVPMLFLLPQPLVPLLTCAYLLLALWHEIYERRLSVTLVCARIADAFYSLGPTLVLVLFNAGGFSWVRWYLYVAAFLAQVVFDIGGFVGRSWFAERIVPSAQMQLAWLYATEVSLTVVGLLLAATAATGPGMVLLAIPIIALLGMFARERRERMDHTLALSTAYRGTAMLLGDVIDADDDYTGTHSREVVDMSVAVAERLGLDAAAKLRVEFGALLHDVGKVRVPNAIIRKPGKLDDAEWEIMRQHTIYGEQMLKQVGGTLSSVGKVVRGSHERYDGGGYPDGLAGEAIPIEARIVSACDALNAMITNRSYRSAMPLEDATAELRRCAGNHFDPRVVQALLRELEPGVEPELEPVAGVAAR